MAPQWVRKQRDKEQEALLGLRVKAKGIRNRSAGSQGTVVQTAVTDQGARIAIRWDQDGTIDWLTPAELDRLTVEV